MAQTNYTPISLYYSATTTNVPTAGNLVAGELAINTADGKLFYKDSSGVVQTLATKGGVNGTSSGQVLFNSSGAVGGSNNLFWDSANARLGIGTASPSNKLDVAGGVIGTSFACNVAGGNASFTNTSAGDARPLFIANSNAAGIPNGLLFIQNTNDANNTSYSFIQAVGGSTPRFVVYGNGDVNTTGILSTKSRGISAGSVPVGSVIQVVNSSYNTSVSSSSSTGVATGLTATITPLYSTSKILITVTHTGCEVSSAATGINIYLTKNGSTNIANLGNVLGYPATGGVSFSNSGTILDSPATTSAVTYATYFASWQNVPSVTVQWQSSTSYITLMEIAA
jgi:hypothetical protein